jgi:hypothetical protein
VAREGVLVRGVFETPANEELPGSSEIVVICRDGKICGATKAIRDGETRRFDFELHFTNAFEPGEQSYDLYRGVKPLVERKVGSFKLKVVPPGRSEQASVNDAAGADIRLVVDDRPTDGLSAEPSVR